MVSRKNFLKSMFGVFLLMLITDGVFGASKITTIDFVGTSDPSEITIRADGPLKVEKTENLDAKQIVLEFKDAQLSKTNTRKIDTSSFDGNVVLVSPYQVKNQADVVRVVLQLREAGTAEISENGNEVKIKVPNSTALASTNPNNQLGLLDATSSEKSNSSEDEKPLLSEFVDSRSAQQFKGKTVTLQVRDADVADVLRLIGEASGFNIIIGDDVKGKLTLSLVDVPWDQALDVVLHTLKLGAERNNNILRVVTLASLTAEKQEEFRAAKAAEASAPRVTRVFPINYANIKDLQVTLAKYVSSISNNVSDGLGSGTQMASSTSNGNVQIDERTNSIIVRDLPENIEKIRKLIEILDTQTPQVMIESKVVEATEGFQRTLSGSLGFGNSDTFVASFAGANPVDTLISSPGVFADGAAVASRSTSNGGTAGMSFNIIPSVLRLNALLTWGESENYVKIVASPKTVVLNKGTAEIFQGTPVLVPSSTTVSGVGQVPMSTVQEAKIGLKVKPTVTNDGGVLMELRVYKDVPMSLAGGQQGIGTRYLETLVLVDSGSTLVIGGIYNLQTNASSGGFPILRKIPILGALFGNEAGSTDRSELFIFVTPRVLNAKEAGVDT